MKTLECDGICATHGGCRGEVKRVVVTRISCPAGVKACYCQVAREWDERMGYDVEIIPEYVPGKRELTIQMIHPPEGTSGRYGHYTETDGIFIEWNNDGELSVVLLKDGVHYMQTLDEFVKNSRKL